MEITNSYLDRTVGDVVAEDFRRGAIFKRFGIDFCCGGGKKVRDACDKKGVDYAELEAALLEETEARDEREVNARDWTPAFLADYIVNVHHRYVRRQLPVLLEFTKKVARVHGEARPELVEIAGLFQQVAAELTQHMAKEEQILFPFIRRLYEAQASAEGLAPSPFGTVRNPIRMMEHEHDSAGSAMARIRALSDDFTPPEWACNTYRASYAELEAFEDDLHRHVHLENNILFPKAIALENELLAA